MQMNLLLIIPQQVERWAFSARYEPYDEPSDGLTDGDWVGVTAFAGDVGAFSDGAPRIWYRGS